MAYTLHVNGTKETVTVARAEEFEKTTGNKIRSGLIFGEWFCFSFKSAKYKKEDKELLAKWFPDTFIETSAERGKRLKSLRESTPKPTALLSDDVHLMLAKRAIEKFPDMGVLDVCRQVGKINREYAEAHIVEHNALDYYAVQGKIMNLMNYKSL